jgi:cytochrome c556
MAELNAAGDEPPEAWKPWLEPLMKMANGEQPFNLQAVLDALASVAQARPPDQGEPPPRH